MELAAFSARLSLFWFQMKIFVKKLKKKERNCDRNSMLTNMFRLIVPFCGHGLLKYPALNVFRKMHFQVN